MKKILNYIDGKMMEPKKFLENFNPSTGMPYSLVPDSDESDVTAAVEAARKAFPAWAKTPVEERAAMLRKIAALIGDRVDELARAESMDNGKPFALARSLDIPRSKRNFEFYADAVTQLQGEYFSTNERTFNFTTYSPLGVVASISPWNLPLYVFTWKIAPALAVGCTVVAKPSEVTPMTAYLFTEICREAGLPPGVLNVVHGRGPQVGTPLVTNPHVKAVSFTGSTATGRAISQATAGSFKKISLEMGGKNPNIVFADCDFEKAVETTMRSSFANQGQICLCGSRILVERPIYNKFRDALVERAKKLRQGDPLDPATEQGALVSESHMNKVLSYIQLARQEGAKILCGGSRAELPGALAKGYFVQPTLIEGSAWNSRVNTEEIFGPIASLIPFDTEDEAIRIANSVSYGLSASVWTQDIARGTRVARLLENGVVWVNTWMVRDLRTPFGGVKESGLGREGGMYSLKFFSEIKNICVEET